MTADIPTTHDDFVTAGARSLLKAEQATTIDDAQVAALIGIGYAILAGQVHDDGLCGDVPELVAGIPGSPCILPANHTTDALAEHEAANGTRWRHITPPEIR